MDVTVEPIQAMNRAFEGGEEPSVQVGSPMGRQDRMSRRFGGDTVSNVIDLGVRDVPALVHR